MKKLYFFHPYFCISNFSDCLLQNNFNNMAVRTFWFFFTVIVCICKQIPAELEYDSFWSPLKLGPRPPETLPSPLLPMKRGPSDDPSEVAQKINSGSCSPFAVIGAIS
jgi:hypothetical protein